MSQVGGDPSALAELSRDTPAAATELRRAARRLADAASRWNGSTEPAFRIEETVSGEVGRLASSMTELDSWAGRVGDALAAADAAPEGVPTDAPSGTRRLAELLATAPGARQDELVADLLVRLEQDGEVTREDLAGIEVDDLSGAGQRSGLSLDARDLINRTAIERWLEEQPPTDVPRAMSGAVASEAQWDRLVALRAIVGAGAPPGGRYGELLDESPLTVTRFVPEEGPDGEPTLQVLRGDPDAVEHVTVWVPGTTHGVHTLDEQLQAADRLQREARQLDDGAAEVGVLIDLYDAPDALILDRSNAARPAYGQQHADALQGAVADARSVAGDGNVLLLGHSYGSYAAGRAADGGVAADDLALVGSPGTGSLHADELDLDPGGDVHVARAPKDQIDVAADIDEELPGTPRELGLGPDPADADFGARAFEVNDHGLDPWDPQYAAGHSSYLLPGSQSLANLATIAVGGEPTRSAAEHADHRLVEVDAPGPGFIDDDVARHNKEFYGGTDVTRAEP